MVFYGVEIFVFALWGSQNKFVSVHIRDGNFFPIKFADRINFPQKAPPPPQVKWMFPKSWFN